MVNIQINPLSFACHISSYFTSRRICKYRLHYWSEQQGFQCVIFPALVLSFSEAGATTSNKSGLGTLPVTTDFLESWHGERFLCVVLLCRVCWDHTCQPELRKWFQGFEFYLSSVTLWSPTALNGPQATCRMPLSQQVANNTALKVKETSSSVQSSPAVEGDGEGMETDGTGFLSNWWTFQKKQCRTLSSHLETDSSHFW